MCLLHPHFGRTSRRTRQSSWVLEGFLHGDSVWECLGCVPLEALHTVQCQLENITSCHGDLSNTSFSYDFGGWRAEIEMWCVLFILKPISFVCRWPNSSCAFLLPWGPSISFYKDTSNIRLASTHITLLHLNYPPIEEVKCPVVSWVPILGL